MHVVAMLIVVLNIMQIKRVELIISKRLENNKLRI